MADKPEYTDAHVEHIPPVQREYYEQRLETHWYDTRGEVIRTVAAAITVILQITILVKVFA